MGSDLINGLLQALAVAALVLLLWSIVSIIAYLVKLGLVAMGVAAFPAKAVSIANSGRFGRPTLDRFLERSRAAFSEASDRKSVRVVLDQRHRWLKERLVSANQQIHDTARTLDGLGGGAGPQNLLQQVRDLDERTKAVEALGVDIDESVIESYAKSGGNLVTLVFLAIFAVVCTTMNGLLLNQFFQGVITLRTMGVPVSLVVSLVLVALEFAGGLLLAVVSQPGISKFWTVFIAVALAGFAIFETVVLGMVSYNFDLELPLLDDYPYLKLWMGLLGLSFVITTSALGYWLHKTMDDRAQSAGVRRLRREIEIANTFVGRLPDSWSQIAARARQAESSITGYLNALGGQEGKLTGAIDEVRRERDALTDALVASRIDDWDEIVDGQEGDQRGAAAQNLGLFLLTALMMPAFVFGLYLLSARALTDLVPWYGSLVIAVCVAGAFYSLGLLAFRRLQLVEGRNGRAQPIRSGPLEIGTAALVLTGCVIGVAWICLRAFGGWGILAAALIVSIGLVLSLCGYGMERAARGLALVATVGVSFISAVLTGAVGALALLLIWSVAAVAFVLLLVITILAVPTDLVVRWARSRRRPTEPSSGVATA